MKWNNINEMKNQRRSNENINEESNIIMKMK